MRAADTMHCSYVIKYWLKCSAPVARWVKEINEKVKSNGILILHTIPSIITVKLQLLVLLMEFVAKINYSNALEITTCLPHVVLFVQINLFSLLQ